MAILSRSQCVKHQNDILVLKNKSILEPAMEILTSIKLFSLWYLLMIIMSWHHRTLGIQFNGNKLIWSKCTIRRSRSKPMLGQVIASRLFDAKPLPGLTLSYCRVNQNNILWNLMWKSAIKLSLSLLVIPGVLSDLWTIVYGWARSKPVREAITFVTSFIAWSALDRMQYIAMMGSNAGLHVNHKG